KSCAQKRLAQRGTRIWSTTSGKPPSDANARLLKAYPKGFPLDATHTPHITMLQRYVQTANLDKLYAAVGNVLLARKPTGS
ncbi:MAG: hypothetical protein WCE36_30575, partial [Pseudolabrys sp.]